MQGRRLPGPTTVSMLYYKRTDSLERALDHLFIAVRPGVPRRLQRASSCPTAAWTKTTWPFPRCWRSRRVEQHLVRTKPPHGRQRRAGDGGAAGRAPLRARCWATARGRSTPIWPWNASDELIEEGLLDKDLPRRRSRITSARSCSGVSQDRLQDGHLHAPVLSEQPRSSRPWASPKRSSTATSPSTVSRVGGIGLAEIDARTWNSSHDRAFDPLGLDNDTDTGLHRHPSGCAAAATRRITSTTR